MDDRIPLTRPVDFNQVTDAALNLDRAYPAIHLQALKLLEGIRYWPDSPGQDKGATYKQLALIAHKLGMTYGQRIGWYRICERLQLRQDHAGYIIKQLYDSDRLWDELRRGNAWADVPAD
jgi:hypothetical protein